MKFSLSHCCQAFHVEDIILRPLNTQIHHKGLDCYIQPSYSTTGRIQGCRMLVQQSDYRDEFIQFKSQFKAYCAILLQSWPLYV